MQNDLKCKYSVLKIPNDYEYVDVATSYIRQIAAKFGFDDEDGTKLASAAREAVVNVIQHAYDPAERAVFEITCERVPLGIRVSVKDEGLPFDVKAVENGENSGSSRQGNGIRLMKEAVDEVHFNNLGKSGKETVLVKYLKNRNIEDYFEVCDLEPYVAIRKSDRAKPAEKFTVRPMKPSEAVEVSRSMYRAYGYSYTYEHVYYPERMVELNRSGLLYSVIAVTENGDYAGHCALIRHSEDAEISEIGMGVVRPEYRSLGILTALTRYLVKKAEKDGLTGIYGQPVTTHVYSQTAGHKMGLRDCALLLGYVPATVVIKEIAEKLPQRETLGIHFMYLKKPPRVVLHAPPHHAGMIARIWENLGITPEIKTDSIEPTGGRSVMVTGSGPPGIAWMEVKKYGSDAEREVKAALRLLSLKHKEIVYLYLNLSDPATSGLVKRFEESGFFFAGILPASGPGDGHLILQYLNNVVIDYDRIKMFSPLGKELLDYVRSHDPNTRFDRGVR